MSVQFGKWNFDGKPVDPRDLDEVRPVLAPYGPDGEGYICKDNIGIVYRAFIRRWSPAEKYSRTYRDRVAESHGTVGWITAKNLSAN